MAKMTLLLFKKLFKANVYVQKNCVGLIETFATVVKFKLLLLVLGEVIDAGWHVLQVDNSNASLTSEIDRDLNVQWDDESYKQYDSPYRQRKSPKYRHEKLSKTLKNFGVKRLESFESIPKVNDDRFKVVGSA